MTYEIMLGLEAACANSLLIWVDWKSAPVNKAKQLKNANAEDAAAGVGEVGLLILQ